MNNIKPKVGIFTRPIDQGTSGSGSHLEQLVKNILEYNKDFEIVFIHYVKNRDKSIYNGINDIVIPRNPIKASKLLKKEKFDILHYSPLTIFAPIWIKNVKKVATIHGAAPLFLPKQYKLTTKLHDKYIRRYFSRKMDHIFTVSKASKDYLNKAYKITNNKISITYNAVDSSFRQLKEINREINGINFDDEYRYIFHLSKYSERKNPTVILKAFREIATKADDIKLILAGSGWKNLEVLNYLKHNNLEDRVIFPGFISREDIVNIFNFSDVFIFPSFYEGFGMPNIESMACGCPVITSNVFAIPEVVGDAALILNDNRDFNELSDKVFEILNSSKTSKELVEKGFIQAAKYSWKKSANTVLSVYKELINSNSREI